MISNLNEKCLLKFLCRSKESLKHENADIVGLLNKLNVKIEIKNFNEIYDIIEEYENN